MEAPVGRENTVIVVLAAIPVVESGTEIVIWPFTGRSDGLVKVNCSTVAVALDEAAALYPLIPVPVELVAAA